MKRRISALLLFMSLMRTTVILAVLLQVSPVQKNSTPAARVENYNVPVINKKATAHVVRRLPLLSVLVRGDGTK